VICTHGGELTNVSIEDGLRMERNIQQIEVDVLAAMTGI
jgi:hypothetical protein